MNLKRQTINGVIWSAVEKLSVRLGQIVITVILARLLLPSDFGLIGMLSIFLVISETLMESGMSTGLIQKKDRTDIDISTVFVFNLIISIVLYTLFFITAPLIGKFYEMPMLVVLTRVLMLNIIISAFSVIQRALIMINIDFKTYAKVNLIAVFTSGIISIIAAYLGVGVWALVFQYLLRTLIETILLWYYNYWKISIQFSIESFKNLFNYGYKILLSSLYSKFLYEIYNVVIGKKYSATSLGFYTKGKQFAEMLASTITAVVDQVTFPVLASIQDEKQRFTNVLEKSLDTTSYFVIPALTLLVLLADPLVKFFLNENWYPVISIIQIMALARFFYPMSIINLNVLKSIGRSDLFLLVNLSKMPFIIAALIITIPMGIEAIAWGQVITSFIGYIINTIYPGKYYNMGFFNQIKRLLPVFVITFAMSLVVYFTMKLFSYEYIKLLFGVFSGASTYILLSHIFKLETYNLLKQTIKEIRM